MPRLLRLFAIALWQTLMARARRGPLRPTWGLGFEWIVTFLRLDFAETAAWPYPKLRAELDARRYPSAARKRVSVRDEPLGGRPARWFTPPEPRLEGVLLYFHGGSYILGSAKTTHEDIIARLAVAARVAAVGVDYRLAPEHPYPAALEDALAAFDELVARGTPPGAIVVGGDSAGGNLALALQLALRDRGSPQAGAAALVSPWLDLSASRPSTRENDAVDYGTRAMLVERHAPDFAGGIALDDPRVSPINARLAGLAPLLIVAGQAERLHDEAVEFVERARAEEVDAALVLAADMPHNPPVLAAYHPEAARAADALGAFIARRLRADDAVGRRMR
jgi:epsilon-lactone hydrolase